MSSTPTTPAKRLKKVLVANRGEIAVRIVRACRAEGIKSVAVYSDPDRREPHVRLADEAVRLPGSSPTDTYLRGDLILAAAEQTGADGVHPGYGFLSQNAEFADACVAAGLAFVGPSGYPMRLMGEKIAARRKMQGAGVPIVPGTVDACADAAEARRICDDIGYPVMLKAVAGGGGKGIRKVDRSEDVENAFERASSEAIASFGNGDIYVEKAIDRPRHVEIQVLADAHGNVIHLGERECSLQRRHQKVIEEAPSAWLPDSVRQEMGAAAVAAARAVDYVNAGTVEFLVDQSGTFYYLEMNTRLQVEHPVTEMVYGVDIVREQLRIAAGEPLSIKQDQVVARGHAVEVRICAEDPAHGFFPSAGVVEHLELPGGPGVRLDTSLWEGQEVTLFYDSMLGKLICWGADRDEALRRADVALRELVVSGIQTNAAFAMRLLRRPEVQAGHYDTSMIDTHLAALTGVGAGRHKLAAAIAAALVHRERARTRVRSSAPATGGSGPSPWVLRGRGRAMRGSGS